MKVLYSFLIFLQFLSLSVNARSETLSCSELPDTAVTVDLPMVTPYFLQHQYLSVVASMIKEADGFILQSPEILNTISANGNGFRSPFKDNDIKVDSVGTDGKTVYVWRFPEPEYLREALYMAFFPVNGFYKAYAISKGQLVDWEISTSTEKSRATYGRIKRPESAQECVELLKSRGAIKGEISGGEFLQEGYSCPPRRQTDSR